MTFSFKVTLEYRDAQAFNDEDPEHVHDRLNRRIFDLLASEFADCTPRRGVTVEVEPA